MLARLNGQELHFFGTPKAFNAMARAIRKGRHGDSQSMPLEQEQSSFSTLFLSCSGQSSRIWIEHSEVHIQYAEASKNRLYLASPCPLKQRRVRFFSSTSGIRITHRCSPTTR